ncbi:restriction endonuclease subunit S [Bifidobacterium mongoliense]|uniref:restriction endonuclease subunit S n=1 Tax=Bifidobacterium mongoliense TaxID=518643 RepID=UPI0030F410AE
MTDDTSRVPKLRFPGFAGAWEQRKLGELGSTFTGLTGKTKEDFGHGDAKFVTYMNVFQNAVASLEQLDSVEIDPKQNEVKKGDVFFTTSSETPEEVGMSSVWKYNYDNVYLNSFTFGYRPNIEFDLDYLAAMLRSTTVRKKITFLAQGISRYNISKTKMMDIEVPVPSLEEQAKIGAFLSNVEQTITLHQRKLSHLRQLKKGLLQKMFPKSGEDRPEVRFPGFVDAWEQRKLGELVQSFDYGLNASAIEFDGKNKYLRITDIDDETHQFNTDALTSPDADLKTADNFRLRVGDVLFARTGASVGKTYRYKGSDGLVYFAGFLIRARTRPEYDSEFLFQNTLTDRYMRYISITSRRSGQPGVNAQEYAEFRIFVPSLAEQKRTSGFFSMFDDLITLHQRKLSHLQQQKKALLQQMFV